MKNKFNWGPLILIELIALLGIGAYLIFANNRPLQANPMSYTAQKAAEFERTKAAVSDPTQQAFLQEKINQLQAVDKARALNRAAAPTKAADLCAAQNRISAASEGKRLVGVLNDLFPPPHLSAYQITNAWQDQVNGVWVQVYAGSQIENPEQGLVVVSYENAPGGGVVLAPAQSGLLRITASDRSRLTLQNDSGIEYYFDVPSGTFVDSLRAEVPVVVPLPTYTPQPGLCP